jgi:multidrug efflux pump subunit AcrB
MVKRKQLIPLRERFNISRLAIAYPWLTLSFWLAVTVAGILAFSSLKYALFPDITFPVVVVSAQGPFTTALDTETRLTQPLEQALQALRDDGLDDIDSSSYPGQSAVRVSFAVGTNLEESSRKVEATVRQLALPKGSTFKVIPFNLNESAVVSYVVESNTQTLPNLAKIARTQIVPSIAQLPGVLKVELLGDPAQTPALAAEAPGAAVPTEAANLVRFNGKDTLALQVIKRGDANTLEVVNQVEQEVGRLQPQLAGVQLTLAATQADYIRDATQSTIDALIEAIVLAVVVIFPFLWNFRATLISALAIPASLLGTFIVMAIYGFNLETITLLALALVIGSIVDDAIVDVENIMRHIEAGESPKQAALSATNEIGLTVTAATLTSVAVFLPIALMHGVIGQFFKPFGITVSAAMLTSLLVARTLSPVLAIYWLKPHAVKAASSKHDRWTSFTQGYRNLLHWSLNHRAIVMGVAVLSLVGGIALVPLIPKGFIPKLDRGEFNVTYTAPQPKLPRNLRQSASPSQPSNAPRAANSRTQLAQAAGQPLVNPLNDSRQVAEKLEAAIRQTPQVEKVFTVIGSREGEPNKGVLHVRLKPDRTITTAQLQDQIRANLPNLPGVSTSVEDIQFVDTGGEKPLQITLQGNDLKALSQTAIAVKKRLEQLSGFEDVTVTGATENSNQILQIQRSQGQRVAHISANLGKGLTLGDATDRAVAEAEALLPANVSLDLGGDSARLNEIFGSFGSTLMLSALCILAVLILLFKNWVDPLVVCFSLPLALVGAMLALLITQSDFGMISLIGFVFLLGLTNKNAILIVDYINQLRAAGVDRTEAILQAGPVRLRPILMTTAATILGMVPIALGLGAGSELRSPMAVAIAGGLITSTLLSLIVVPVVYALLDDWRFKTFKRQRTGRRTA